MLTLKKNSSSFGSLWLLSTIRKETDEDKPKRVTLPKSYDQNTIGMNIASQLIKLPITLGNFPNSEDPVIANIGAYGPYVKYQDIFASLGRKYDVLEIDLDQAVELITIKKINLPIK